MINMADPRKPEDLARLQGRNGTWWRMYCAGRTMESIAAEYGVDKSTVSRAVSQVRDSLPEETREEEVRRSLEMLRELRAGAVELWQMAPAPIFVGKDGVPAIDPDTNEVVRDHSGRLRALETAVKVDQRIAQLLGLDAASKLDMSVSGAEERAAELLAQDAARRLAGNTSCDQD